MVSLSHDDLLDVLYINSIYPRILASSLSNVQSFVSQIPRFYHFLYLSPNHYRFYLAFFSLT